MKLIAMVAGALALCAAFGAAAQKVYRCGPDGRTYQQTACADGRAVDASDPRTAEQRQAAQAVAKSDAKAPAQLDRDMNPPAASKSGKVKPEPAPAPAPAKAASGAKSASKKADAESNPLLYLVPKPKDAASAVK